jgi:hypothetical protein
MRNGHGNTGSTLVEESLAGDRNCGIRVRVRIRKSTIIRQLFQLPTWQDISEERKNELPLDMDGNAAPIRLPDESDTTGIGPGSKASL